MKIAFSLFIISSIRFLSRNGNVDMTEILDIIKIGFYCRTEKPFNIKPVLIQIPCL